MAMMVHSEEAAIALLSRQYSESNTVALMRRGLSHTEHKLFMEHAFSHFELFNSPTYDAQKWTKTGFFHGPRNMKYDPDLLPVKSDVNTKRRANMKPLPKRRKHKFMNMEHFAFFLGSFRDLPSAQPPAEEINFLGKVFALRPYVSKTVSKEEITLAQGKQKKAKPKQRKGKRQSKDTKSKNYKDSNKASDSESDECRCFQSIYFKSEPRQIVFTSDRFDEEV
jgi:hypothetical protein